MIFLMNTFCLFARKNHIRALFAAIQSAVNSSKKTVRDQTTGLKVFNELNATINNASSDIRSFTNIPRTYDYYRLEFLIQVL